MEFDYGIIGQNHTTEGNYIIESYYRKIIQKCIAESRYGQTNDHISTNASKSFRCTALAQRPPSEPRDHSVSPEELPWV